jgi:hypothetical protein
MTDEAGHEQVLDTLLDLQAKLRGDDLTRRLDAAAPPRTKIDADPERSLHVAPEPVSVLHADVEVVQGSRPPTADRLAALSDRLQRVERELTLAMDRLREAEARYVNEDDESEPAPPEPESSVYQRVQELQGIATDRQHRRRR